MKIDNSTIELLIKTFGVENQKIKAIEEMAELTTAILHHKEGKVTLAAVVDEIADVFIMATQLRAIYGAELVDDRIEEKMAVALIRANG